jgi:hypothetical protein
MTSRSRRARWRKQRAAARDAGSLLEVIAGGQRAVARCRRDCKRFALLLDGELSATVRPRVDTRSFQHWTTADHMQFGTTIASGVNVFLRNGKQPVAQVVSKLCST